MSLNKLSELVMRKSLNFSINNGYVWGRIDKTMFVEKDEWNLITSQIHVDDIMFDGMSRKMVIHFVQQIQFEFEMSPVGELAYFLRFQVKQMKDVIFLSQSKYAINKLAKYKLENDRHKLTSASTHVKLTKDD